MTGAKPSRGTWVENTTGVSSTVSVYIIVKVLETLDDVSTTITFTVELDIVAEITLKKVPVAGVDSVLVTISEIWPLVEPTTKLVITLLMILVILLVTTSLMTSI